MRVEIERAWMGPDGGSENDRAQNINIIILISTTKFSMYTVSCIPCAGIGYLGIRLAGVGGPPESKGDLSI